MDRINNDIIVLDAVIYLIDKHTKAKDNLNRNHIDVIDKLIKHNEECKDANKKLLNFLKLEILKIFISVEHMEYHKQEIQCALLSESDSNIYDQYVQNIQSPPISPALYQEYQDVLDTAISEYNSYKSIITPFTRESYNIALVIKCNMDSMSSNKRKRDHITSSTSSSSSSASSSSRASASASASGI